MKNKLYKYELNTSPIQSLMIPKDRKVLKIEKQKDILCLWVIVDTTTHETEPLNVFIEKLGVVENQSVTIPKGATIVGVENLNGTILLLATLDSKHDLLDVETIKIRMYKTGNEVKEDQTKLTFIGRADIHLQEDLGVWTFIYNED